MKGQTNLFSFFAKKPESVGGVNSAPNTAQKAYAPPKAAEGAKLGEKRPADATAATSCGKRERSSLKISASEAIVQTPVAPSAKKMDTKKEGLDVEEPSAKKAVIEEDGDDDDSDEEPVVMRRRGATTSKPVARKSTKAPQKSTGSDEEEEWDGEDSLSGGDKSDDDDFSADSGSDEEEEEDDDDDAMSEESEDEAPVRKRRAPSAAKASRTKKAPRPNVASEHTPVNTGSSKTSASLSLGSGVVHSRTVSLDLDGDAKPGKPADMESLYLCDRMLSEPMQQSDKQSKAVSDDHIVRSLPTGVWGQGCHEHDLLDWLSESVRQDAKMRKSSHPDYDPRTLFVPPDFMNSQTPAMKQWWKFKSRNLDTILFFKVGKFYELYNMDADVGMSELDLVYMKGKRAHSGFPEVSYGKYAGMLVDRGYRVARVEQTETPDQLKERKKRTVGKAPQVVERELCSIMTKGTRTYCHLDDLTTLLEHEKAGSDTAGGSGSVLMCIKEMVTGDTSVTAAATEYGVCVVDAVIGTVTLAQFQDDGQRSRLRTMIARFCPTEIMLEHNRVVGGGDASAEREVHHSPETLGAVQLMAPRAVLDFLRGDEMPSAEQTIDKVSKGDYYPGGAASKDHWPAVMQAVVAGAADGSSGLVLSALGGAMWQLRRSLIDHDILSMGKIVGYVPPDDATDSAVQAMLRARAKTVVEDEAEADAFMVLDAVSLANLEVLKTAFDGGEKGSLWGFINRCKTPFGRRLLRAWLCKPLYSATAIARRAEAVRGLNMEMPDVSGEVRGVLRGCPDLERLLERVHANGSHKRSAGGNHPDSRAILFEMSTYNGRKIKDFAAVIGGFERVLAAGRKLQTGVTDAVVSQTLRNTSERWPVKEMGDLLSFFRSVFDEKQAAREGKVTPRPGVDAEYDQACADVKRAQEGLERHLKDMINETGLKSLKYFHAQKDRYQIEVHIDQCKRVPSAWSLKSSKKTHRRYYTPVILAFLADMADAEAREKAANTDTLRKLFEKFDGSRKVWTQALACTAQLDALLALADVSSAPGYTWPTVLDPKVHPKPVLEIVQGRHPMLEFSLESKGGEYIPNSVTLGGQDLGAARLMLLSGPNMGGKSTLLRQTCLISIMAQLGCAVPAESCLLTPIDRIFTRVGASDRILAGQSTFFVELAETAIILTAATQHSLCILDELGRGTATHDGTAIAHAVVAKLVQDTRCRTLFATHYHSLADDWGFDPRVELGHMSCLVSGADEAAESTSVDQEVEREVTFLYSLARGSSPKSYGVNVAKLAALPASVVATAVQRSRDFEASLSARTSGVNAKARTMRHLFDCLVSLVASGMDEDELSLAAKGLWEVARAQQLAE